MDQTNSNHQDPQRIRLHPEQDTPFDELSSAIQSLIHRLRNHDPINKRLDSTFNKDRQ